MCFSKLGRVALLMLILLVTLFIGNYAQACNGFGSSGVFISSGGCYAPSFVPSCAGVSSYGYVQQSFVQPSYVYPRVFVNDFNPVFINSVGHHGHHGHHFGRSNVRVRGGGGVVVNAAGVNVSAAGGARVRVRQGGVFGGTRVVVR